MPDGPGSVSTLILVVVGSTDGGELLLREEDKLARLDVDGMEGDSDCGKRVGGKRDKGVDGDDDDDAPGWVGDKGEGNGNEDKDKVESEGAAEAEARAATRRMRTAEDRMDVQRGTVD